MKNIAWLKSCLSEAADDPAIVDLLRGVRDYEAGLPPPAHDPHAAVCGAQERRWIGHRLAHSVEQDARRETMRRLGVEED